MAQFVFEIPDAEAARIALAVCSANGYGPADAADAADFTATYVFQHLARIVIEQEANAAAVAAGDAVRANAADPLAQAVLRPIRPEPPKPTPPRPEPPGPVGPTGPDFGGWTGATGQTGS